MNTTLMFHGIRSAEIERRPESDNWLSLNLIDLNGNQQTIDIFAMTDESSEIVCDDLTLIAEGEQEAAP